MYFISFVLRREEKIEACYTLRNEGDIFMAPDIEFTFARKYVKQK